MRRSLDKMQPSTPTFSWIRLEWLDIPSLITGGKGWNRESVSSF